MSDEINLRKEVKEFAIAMEKTLRKHDHCYGDSWRGMSINDLMDRAKDELEELKEYFSDCDPEGVVCETVDIANFYMFIRANLLERSEKQ